MSSTTDSENALPLEAPTAEFPLTSPSQAVKYQVYSLADLSLEERQKLIERLHEDDAGPHNCRLSSGDRLAQSLREVYDYHIRARDQDKTIHPYFFVVVEQSTPHDLLVVYLKASRSDGKRVVGVCRCGVGEADLMGANLDVGNIDWIEYKEAEQEKFGGDSPYTNPRYFLKDPRTLKQDDTSAPATIAYAWFSLVPRPLRFQSILEPNWTHLKDEERRFGYPGNVHKCEDPWSEIKRLYPRMCQVAQRTHRELLLVAEKEDVDVQEGMSIYRAIWNADRELSNLSESVNESAQQEARSIMPDLKFLEWTQASTALKRLDEIATSLSKKSS